jgi:hypothetical protein
VKGNVELDGTTASPTSGDASTANDLCGAAVSGNVRLAQSGAAAPFDVGAAPDCPTALSVSGNLVVEDNAGEVTIGPAQDDNGNVVRGNIQVEQNTGGGSLKDNSAGGNCDLGNDSPGIVGNGNSAAGHDDCNTTA